MASYSLTSTSADDHYNTSDTVEVYVATTDNTEWIATDNYLGDLPPAQAFDDDCENKEEEMRKYVRKIRSIEKKKYVPNRKPPLHWQGWRSRR